MVVLLVREYRAQWGSSSLVVHLVVLTVRTSFDIVFDILNHMGPPVSSCREFQGSGDSWMAIGWWVVMHLYYGASRTHVSCYYELIVFLPCPTYLFEFVGVYPRLQHFFVLV